MTEHEEWYEYGYRLEDREVWAIDHGSDGVWTPYQTDIDVRNVDLYHGDDAAAKIRDELDRAGVRGVVIRRKVSVTYGEVEEISYG